MITIRALLDRIRWDRAYGRGEFVIGYYDRVDRRLLLVPLAAVEVDPENRLALRLTDAAGEVHSIPLHRVYVVYRNGAVIWERQRRG